MADGAATFIHEKCHPERVGVIDLVEELGLPEDPAGFMEWWDETTGSEGKAVQDGITFLREIDRKAKWRRFSPIIDDDDKEGPDVEDQVRDVDPRALHGVLGWLVEKTQPETEANAFFVLLHLMAIFGTAAGRNPHLVVSATRHYLNLFIGLIGTSGFGRKGTAGYVAKAIWRKVDPDFTDRNIVDGLNSGAGLLYHLRDASKRPGKGGSAVDDPGVSDKDRLFLESELSSVLMQGHRESDPLLGHLRKFFDGDDIVRSNTKDPTQVTGGHVSVVGHCTPADLEIHLSDADKANGTANRFLWQYGVRSKLLARGGNVFKLLDDDTALDVREAIEDLKASVAFARTVREIGRSREVEERWEQLYRDFNEIPPGRIGAFFVRAPVQVMRQASIFALADRKGVIGIDHLEAALASWRHSARSLRYVFKADINPRAEKLLAAIKAAPDGLTRSQISIEVFQKHVNARSIDELLVKLLTDRAIIATPPVSKGGRPAVRYCLKKWWAHALRVSPEWVLAGPPCEQSEQSPGRSAKPSMPWIFAPKLCPKLIRKRLRKKRTKSRIRGQIGDFVRTYMDFIRRVLRTKSKDKNPCISGRERERERVQGTLFALFAGGGGGINLGSCTQAKP